MDGLLASLFSLVCGRNLAHTWAPAGELLPFCERCTGLYAGAAAAFALLLLCRPRPTARFLWLHGLFLLQMAPQGFHLVYQDPLLRTVSGTLFAFGLAAYLMPAPRGDAPGSVRAYAVGVLAALAGIVVLAEYGGAFGAAALRVLAVAGFAVYAVLIVRFVAVCARGACGRARAGAEA